jgi:type II secretory pathway pseudopilin PulG
MRTDPVHREPRRARRPEAGFNIVEMLIGVGIIGVAVSAMVVFTEVAMRSLASVNQQAQANQKVGYLSAFVMQRVRLANFMTNNPGQTEILLAFDDDTASDANGDENAYNDRDHYEVIRFDDGDSNPLTTADNRILYVPDTNKNDTVVLMDGGAKYLPGTNLFVMADHPAGTTNGYRTVHLNVGFYYEEGGNRTQTIELRTSAFRRN